MNSNDPATIDRFQAIATETRRLAALGFLACTAGNSSIRWSDSPLVAGMSASGIDKTQIGPGDFILVDAEGRPMGGDARKPSDETLLHLALYRAVGCGAVCHGHPPHAVALSLDAEGGIPVRGLEMIKAFAGITTHTGSHRLPVVENSQDMHELAEWTLASRQPEIPAVIVRGHGVYSWGRTPAEAGRHLETVEWLCRVLLLSAQAGVRPL
jgi:methylthioribulose-1-phosphate dehydratase